MPHHRVSVVFLVGLPNCSSMFTVTTWCVVYFIPFIRNRNHHDAGNQKTLHRFANIISAFSITFWVGGWPRVEDWAFSCLLQMTFKESHMSGAPHSNNISQLGTGLSKVLWVAGYTLWSRRLHMLRAHDGVAVAGGARGGFPLPMKFFKNLNCIWSYSS
jgi:hypothetical protein